MDKRIFVEKKADFRVKSQSLVKELKHNLQLKTLNDLRIVQDEELGMSFCSCF